MAYGDNGHEKTSDATVKKAIKTAQAQHFVEKMPDSYDAHIAQGGTNISGGQKQRLAIARAIARDPEIYIFDDSFSALDYKTDAALRKALKEYTKDATSLIVAQRIGTIMHADQVIVVVPNCRPVTNPLSFTVATSSFEEVQSKSSFV